MRIDDLDTNGLFLSGWITTIRHCHFFMVVCVWRGGGWGAGGRQDFDSSECSNSWLGHETSPMSSIHVTALSFSLLAMSRASQWRQLFVVGADCKKHGAVCSLDLLDQRSLSERVWEDGKRPVHCRVRSISSLSCVWIGSVVCLPCYILLDASNHPVPPFPFPFWMVPPRLTSLCHLQSSLHHRASERTVCSYYFTTSFSPFR